MLCESENCALRDVRCTLQFQLVEILVEDPIQSIYIPIKPIVSVETASSLADLASKN